MYKKNDIFLFDTAVVFSKMCAVVSNEQNSIVLNYVSKRKKTRYSDIQRELKNKSKNKSKKINTYYIIKKLLKENMLSKVKLIKNTYVTQYALTFKGHRVLEIEQQLLKYIEKEKSERE